jgi:ribosome modulation factor
MNEYISGWVDGWMDACMTDHAVVITYLNYQCGIAGEEKRGGV